MSLEVEEKKERNWLKTMLKKMVSEYGDEGGIGDETIMRMDRILRIKLDQDGLTVSHNHNLMGLMYEWLSIRQSRALLYAQGDARVLDEFIDDNWPKLVELSRAPEPQVPPPAPPKKQEKSLLDGEMNFYKSLLSWNTNGY